jgi:hypothetical protein
MLLEPASVLVAREVSRIINDIPAQPGIYGWWFNRGICDVPLRGTKRYRSWRLLYVGIAPNSKRSGAANNPRTLRDRIKNHIRGPSGSSTLRRSLACLLANELKLKPINRKGQRLKLREDDEAQLTRWMEMHAALNFLVSPNPWVIEAKLLASGQLLPLNIRGSTHPFSSQLKKRRAAFKAGLLKCGR